VRSLFPKHKPTTNKQQTTNNMTTTLQIPDTVRPVAIEILVNQGISFNHGIFTDIEGLIEEKASNLDTEEMPDANDIILGVALLHSSDPRIVTAHLHAYIVYEDFIKYASGFFEVELMDYEQACTAFKLYKNKHPEILEVDY
jgi:hypothetical protein